MSMSQLTSDRSSRQFSFYVASKIVLVLWVVGSVQCTVYSVQFTVYSVQLSALHEGKPGQLVSMHTCA
jgi:hypothetical protein